MDNGRWGRRIRAFRKLKRIRQVELAEKLGIPSTMLGKIERGITVPSPELLENIAVQLGIDKIELMGEGSSAASEQKEEKNVD